MRWKQKISGLLAASMLLGLFPAAAFAWDAPENRWAQASRDGIAARFFVGSDTHIGRDAAAEQKLRNALDVFHTIDPVAEGVLLVGDITNNGATGEYDKLMAVVNDSPVPSRVQLVMGNHEYNNSGTMARFQEKTGQKANEVLRYTDDNGNLTATVVKLSAKNYAGDYQDQYSLLQNALEQSQTDNPAAPVIVMGHHGIRSTAYVTEEWYGNYGVGTDRDMVALMAQYPQAIHISGHSHATLEDARSIHQDLGFTAIQDSTIGAYFENEKGKVDPSSGAASTYPADRETASQALQIDVRTDGTIEIHRLNLTQGTYLFEEEPWRFSAAEPLPYTAQRAAQSQAPAFAEDAAVQVSGITDSSMLVKFPAAAEASDDNLDMVHSYRITLTNTANSETTTRTVFADYYLQPRKEQWQVKIADLPVNTTYTVSVQALTSFGVGSETITAAESVTTGQGEAAVYPAQALLDVDFSRDATGADKEGHVQTVFGSPSFRKDETLGRTVASFDGVDDGLRYSMTAEDYTKLTRNFTIELYYKPKDTANNNPMGNTETSGFCFEQKKGTNTLQFWAHIGGAYKKPETTVSKNAWNHVVGTYDGANVKIYLNGQLKNTVAATGEMKEPPRYLFLGGDTSSTGTLQYAANCEIALARVYTGTMTAQDVQAAYQSASTPSGGEEDTLTADMLSVDFSDGTAADQSATANEVKVVGSPVIRQDAELGKQIGSFNGEYDAYLYPFDDAKYAKMAQGVTIESVFRYDEVPSSGEHDIFSNQQSGGIGLGLEDGQLQFYCNVNKTGGGNGYVQPSATIQAGQWYHALGVFDGAQVKLYLNGKLVSQKEAGGNSIHWTTNPNAKNMVIGGDSNSAGGAEFFSKGGVSLARLYSRSINDAQAAQLYAQLNPVMIAVDGASGSISLNQPCTVPTATASNGADVTVTVSGPDGNEISLTDGQFTPSTAGQYTFTYTVAGSAAKRVLVCQAVDTENLPVTLGLVTTEQVAAGGMFQVNVHLNRDTNLTVGETVFDLTYDPTVLRYVGSEHAHKDFTLTDQGNGQLHGVYTGAVSDAPFSNYSQTRLVKLSFQTSKRDDDATAALSFANVSIDADTQGTQLQSASVRVVGKSSLDRNGDGVIGAGDVALATSDEQRKLIAAQAAIYPYKHAVVITMDGGGICFRPDQMYYAENGKTTLTDDPAILAKRTNPYAMSLFNEYFATSYAATSETPTISAQNYTSILHGKEYATAQAEYQIDNTKTGMLYYPDFGKETPVYPSVFMALGQAFPNRANAAFAEWVPILNGIIEPDAPVSTQTSTYKSGSLQDVADYIRSDAYRNTAMVYMQSDYMDAVGHQSGYYSEEYYKQLNSYDAYFQSVMEALEQTGTKDETLLVFTSDHGGTSGGSHGGTSDAEYDVQIALGGQTIQQGLRLTGGTNHDIPALVLSGLRGETPASMDGSDALLRQASLNQERLVAQKRGLETLTATVGTNVNAMELRLSGTQETRSILTADLVIALGDRNVTSIKTAGTVLRQQLQNGKLYLTISYPATPQVLARIQLDGAAQNTSVTEFMLGTAQGAEIYGDLVNTKGELSVDTPPDDGNTTPPGGGSTPGGGGGSSSGGSSSGGGSTSSGNQAGTSDTVTNADGSVTKSKTETTTDASTGAKIQTKTETTTRPDGTVQQTETLTVSGATDGMSGTIVTQTGAEGKRVVTAQLAAKAGETTLQIPVAVAAALQKGDTVRATFSIQNVELTLDAAAMKSMLAAGGQAPQIRITPSQAASLPASLKDSTAFDFTVNGKGVVFDGGSVNAAIAYQKKDASKQISVFYVAADGQRTRIADAVYQDGKVSIPMQHWSVYAIAEETPLPYADVTQTSWYYDAVRYTFEMKLFSGTATNAFSPDAAMTRAMLWTVLARMDGQQTEGGDTWYEKAQQWAIADGVSDGTDPEMSISRQQLAAMLYRFAGSPDTTGSLQTYTDAGEVADYAKKAMAWAVQTGIVSGTTETTLSPASTATRAQVATMMQRMHQQNAVDGT